MNFVVDECTGPAVADWLRREGYEVVSVFENYRGIDDDQIIEIASSRQSILITNDKDFGEKVFREGKIHNGVILLRLADERPSAKIEALKGLLLSLGVDLAGAFVVVTDHGVRIARGR
jgi:predicted nuclease of predicted toxin-antitoxin system